MDRPRYVPTHWFPVLTMAVVGCALVWIGEPLHLLAMGLACIGVAFVSWIYLLYVERAALRRRKRQPRLSTDGGFEPPRIGRMRVHPYPCCVCTKPLNDGDLVVTLGTRVGHAECVVLIKKQDGSVVTQPEGIARGAPVTAPRSTPWLVLYENEWEQWKKDEADGKGTGDLTFVRSTA